jgi:hypothetical protein
MRRSGKRALIQLEQNWESTFDLSGLSTDGISRSNEFKFEITGEVVENVSGFNEKFGETVPVGQSAWTANIKVFYNHVQTEAPAVLATMFSNQHDPATNLSYDGAYRLVIMPDGNVSGYEKYTLYNAVIKNYAPDTPHDAVMTLDATFSGGKWVRELIA